MKGYLEHPRILGLGEVMDAPSVINGSVAMHEKLQLFQDRVRMAMHRFWHLGIWPHMYLAELTQIMSVWIMSMQWLRQEMECRY
mgnify:FL=1